jgi:hypothetical protein
LFSKIRQLEGFMPQNQLQNRFCAITVPQKGLAMKLDVLQKPHIDITALKGISLQGFIFPED